MTIFVCQKIFKNILHLAILYFFKKLSFGIVVNHLENVNDMSYFSKLKEFIFWDSNFLKKQSQEIYI